MTDDLVTRLRAIQRLYEETGVNGAEGALRAGQAADRIEELEAKLRQEVKDKERVDRVWSDNYAALEAKLAKAVDALERIQHNKYGISAARARTTLAILKGVEE